MPGSCSSGLRSRPCKGTGNSRRKGFDAASTKTMKASVSRPSTPNTRACWRNGQWRPRQATASVHSDCISTQSSSEPSCEPQAAVKRYIAGSSEFEFSATLRTEKSLARNEATRQAQASSTLSAIAMASGRASAMRPAWPRRAAASGKAPRHSASRPARISAK